MEMSHMSQRSASAVDKLSMKHYLNPLEGVQEADLERSPSKHAGKAEAVGPSEPQRKVSSPSLILDGRISDGPYSDEGSHVSLMSQEDGPGKPSAEPPPVPSPVVPAKPLNSSRDTTFTAASAASSPVPKPEEPKKNFGAPGGSSLLARRRASLGILESKKLAWLKLEESALPDGPTLLAALVQHFPSSVHVQLGTSEVLNLAFGLRCPDLCIALRAWWGGERRHKPGGTGAASGKAAGGEAEKPCAQSGADES
ncbi:unnamed protein product [Symbiodinium sp. KB8]|nr:unnamed protein product [Symbiodinium sp. KB8]